MSRRKQSRPIRHLEEDLAPIPGSIPSATANLELRASYLPIQGNADVDHRVSCPTADYKDDISPSSEEEAINVPNIAEIPFNGALMCPRCQEQFTDVQEFLTHKAECSMKAKKHDEPAHSDPEDMVVSEDDDEDDETGGKRLERMRRHHQDAANNNSVDEASPEEDSGARLGFPFPLPAPTGHVTLEALQNTKVAVAQFVATTMANNADNEAAFKELAVLQSTLFTLQHQQVLQLQLINQLQQQLSINRSKASSPASLTNENDVEPPPAESPPPSQVISREPTPALLPPPISQPIIEQPLVSEPSPEVILPPSLPPQIQPPLCSISSSLASAIITHNNDPPSLDEPNTLEMLQKRAQEVLDNASQGLLATNLADELAFRKGKSPSPYDAKGRNEPFFKHRCRYCGKVFGSDSALQIHIRSHTGERPYKCNVCGSRFTTKGNLKVHFQRHSAKFPHIKMNPNPVPEHLDKYHPPLLAQLGQQPALSPGGPPHPPHLGFPTGHPFPPTTIPLYRPPGPPPDLLNNRLQPSPHRPPEPSRLFPSHQLFMKREEQEVPENLTKPIRSPPPTPETLNVPDNQEIKLEIHEEMKNQMPELTPKQEIDTDNEQQEQEPERFSSPGPYHDESSIDSSKFSNEDLLGQRSPGMDRSENMQDEPENLSQKSNPLIGPLNVITGQRLPANFPFGHASSPPSSTSSGSLGPFPSTPLTDPAKDPAIYTSLLPRPGSNDNSWESLIEVTKTSETSKLQQLVDNIEHKLSDPNQCVICHRVLSCKSALQMHYRTHTGERPFKCKICGRAFTTKGNLKTHMGVHRAKPPMRVLHQCPVCHKKFTNALVLQQHIRLHTGEPTDLTAEQIQAAEVKDFPSPGAFPQLNSMNPFLSQNFQIAGLSPLGHGSFPIHIGSKLDLDRDLKSEQDYMDDDDDDDDDDMSTSENPIGFSTSPHEQHHGVVNAGASQLSRLSCSAEDLCHGGGGGRNVPPMSPMQNGEKSPTQSGITSPGSSEIRSSPNQISATVQVPRPPSSQRVGSPTPSESNSLGALDLTPKTSQPPISSPGPSPGPPTLFSSFGLLPPTQGSSLMTSALSSLTSSVLTSTSFSPLRLAVGPGVRGNTTCNLCFKTFACNSALEIHYRSHTKERPFKCTVCDRGFSTKVNEECVCGQRRIQDEGERKRKQPQRKKIPSVFPLPMSPGYATASHWSALAGNMKQHMLTHKIRDMPQHMFDKPIMSDEQQNQGQQLPQSQQQPPPPTHPPQQQPLLQQPLPPQQSQPPKDIKSEPELPTSNLPQPLMHQMLDSSSEPVKRAPTENELPLPKRPPSSHGHPYVEQRSVATRATHVARSAAHSHDAQGFRISATEARSLLPVPPGSIP